MQYIRELVENEHNNSAIIGLSETHLSNDIEDKEISIANYNIYRADRVNRTHGGVAVYIKKEIKHKIIGQYSNSMAEYILAT